VKPFTAEFFKPGPQRAWGLTKECRKCLNAREIRRRKTNPAAIETIKQWERRNRDKVLEMRRRQNRKRTLSGIDKEYRANKLRTDAAYREAKRAWYHKNKDRRKATIKAWAAKNRERMRSYIARRRALELGADGRYTGKDVARLGDLQKWKCAACRADIKKRYEIDHVVPLAKGGSNYPSNLQLLCLPCNRRKSDKEPEYFMRELGFLL
jgi:5-methylcytosine-specific restriction endonuclease McrA